LPFLKNGTFIEARFTKAPSKTGQSGIGVKV
jgi:hypothetical protein